METFTSHLEDLEVKLRATQERKRDALLEIEALKKRGSHVRSQLDVARRIVREMESTLHLEVCSPDGRAGSWNSNDTWSLGKSNKEGSSCFLLASAGDYDRERDKDSCRLEQDLAAVHAQYITQIALLKAEQELRREESHGVLLQLHSELATAVSEPSRLKGTAAAGHPRSSQTMEKLIPSENRESEKALSQGSGAVHSESSKAIQAAGDLTTTETHVGQLSAKLAAAEHAVQCAEAQLADMRLKVASQEAEIQARALLGWVERMGEPQIVAQETTAEKEEADPGGSEVMLQGGEERAAMTSCDALALALEAQRLQDENAALEMRVSELQERLAQEGAATLHNNPKQKIQYHQRVKRERDELRQQCDSQLKEVFLLEQCIRYLAAQLQLEPPHRDHVSTPRIDPVAALLPTSLAGCYAGAPSTPPQQPRHAHAMHSKPNPPAHPAAHSGGATGRRQLHLGSGAQEAAGAPQGVTSSGHLHLAVLQRGCPEGHGYSAEPDAVARVRSRPPLDGHAVAEQLLRHIAEVCKAVK